MAGEMFLFVAAIAAAFVAARLTIDLLAGVWSRRIGSLDEGLSLKAIALWRLRNGVRWSAPVGRALLKRRQVSLLLEECRLALAEHGVESSMEALSSVLVASLLLAGLLAALVFGNAVCLVLVPFCIAVLMGAYAASLREKRGELMRESLPSTFDSMAACFGAGYTLLQTFRQVAKDAPGSVGVLFASAANVLEAGGSVEDALGVLKKSDMPEIAFVAVALDVQHQAGGSMRQVLDAAADSVKGELALKRSLRVQTAQAKLSARVVSAMPVILVTLFSIASPTFLTPFFQSPIGWVMLLLAIAMQVMGVLLVRRALSVGGAV